MQQVIIAFSGRKNAGKNSIADFVAKYHAYTVCYPTANYICEASNLLFDTSAEIAEAVKEHVGMFSFADDLKEFCINVLGLGWEQCYGNDAEKNTLTPYLWDTIDPAIRAKTEKTFGPRTGQISGRELMQIFGTELIRDTFGNIWAESTIRRIKRFNKPVNLITDNRFGDEVDAVLRNGGYVVRLTRSPFGLADQHRSEAALDGFDWNKPNCFVLDNANMTIDEQNQAIIPVFAQIMEKVHV